VPRKFDKGWRPLPGFRTNPEQQRELADRTEEAEAKAKVLKAKKKLRAQGFVMDKFQNYIKNLRA
jgi:hypothetical protein